MKLKIIFSYSSSLFIVKFSLTPLLFLHKIWRHQTIKKATGASWRMKGSYYYLNQKKLYMAYEKGDRKNLEVWVAPAFLTGQRWNLIRQWPVIGTCIQSCSEADTYLSKILLQKLSSWQINTCTCDTYTCDIYMCKSSVNFPCSIYPKHVEIPANQRKKCYSSALIRGSSITITLLKKILTPSDD